MDIDDLIYYAENKVLKLLRDNGLKYLHSDVAPRTTRDFKKPIQTTMSLSKTLLFTVNFDDKKNPKRGRELKKNKDIFYDFYNVTIDKFGIHFKYTYKELELEYLRNDDEVAEEVKRDSIMKKIDKLLALQNSSNEHEALSASLMAQKLLAKYNIDIENIRGKVEEEIEEASVYVDSGNKWKYSLASVVADNYRCKVFYKGTDRVVFRGYRTDIVIARRVYAYLFSVAKRLGKAYEKRYRENYGNAEGIYMSYCIGFINGVRLELEKQCTALQLFCPSKVEDDWKKYSADFGEKQTTLKLNDIKAYQQGEVDGKNSISATYLDDSHRYIEE